MQLLLHIDYTFSVLIDTTMLLHLLNENCNDSSFGVNFSFFWEAFLHGAVRLRRRNSRANQSKIEEAKRTHTASQRKSPFKKFTNRLKRDSFGLQIFKYFEFQIEREKVVTAQTVDFLLI